MSPVAQLIKNLPANVEDTRDAGLIPGHRRSPGEGNGNPLQYSCLANSMDKRSLAGYSPGGHKESDMTMRTCIVVMLEQSKFLQKTVKPSAPLGLFSPFLCISVNI